MIEDLTTIAYRQQAQDEAAAAARTAHEGLARGVLTATLLGAAALEGVHIMTNSNALSELPSLSYLDGVQQVVTNLDVFVGVPGFVGLCAASGLIVGNKLRGLGRSEAAARADMMGKLSSRELVSSGGRAGYVGRTMRHIGSGRFPAIAATGVMVASLCNMIGNEITDGPQRPIVAMEQLLAVNGSGFESVIAQDQGANPMGDSAISGDAVKEIVARAKEQGITAVPISKNLGNVSFADSSSMPKLFTSNKDGVRTMAALTFGIPVSPDSPIAYNAKDCNDTLPVYVDETAGFIPKTGAELNGMKIEVVGEKTGLSAINRIGIIADERGLECIKKNDSAHIIAVSGDLETTKHLLQTASTDELATVISMDDYENNSQDFWKKNSKPITNVVALLAMLMAGAATGSNLRLRVEKSRREMAALMATGVQTSTLRSIEALRVAKDTVVATVSGVVGAAAAAPVISSAVYGLQLHMSPKDILVGAGAACIGATASFIKSFGSKKRILKAVDPSEATR